MQTYNTTVRSFPTNLTAMLFKMDVKPNFAVENEAAISAPPKVDFGKKPAAPAVPPPAAARQDVRDRAGQDGRRAGRSGAGIDEEGLLTLARARTAPVRALTCASDRR